MMKDLIKKSIKFIKEHKEEAFENANKNVDFMLYRDFKDFDQKMKSHEPMVLK